MNISKNSIKRNRALFFLFVGIFSWCVSDVSDCYARECARKKRSQNALTAQAACAIDFTSGKIYYSRNARQKFFPASTVKLMTALVVLDHKDVNESVVISHHAASVAPTRAGLTKKAAYTVGDLLKVLLATSANDAGVALAEAVSGSEEKFAFLMNKKARSLGARDSFFTNPTGLPDKRQVTTAYDLSIITRAAFRSPFITAVMKRKCISICGSDGKSITRNNHNKLLWSFTDPFVLGKTGYTKSARHCYAGIADYGDRRVAIVILKSRKPWDDIRWISKIVGKKVE